MLTRSSRGALSLVTRRDCRDGREGREIRRSGVTPTSRRPRLNAPRSGNYVPAAEGCPALAGLSVRPVTRVGPAFARLGPGASTAATRSSGAGGFLRDLVRDGWQAAGSSSRRCSAGCPPVPDAAAGGYADGGIRAGRRRRQEDGRDGQGSRRPGGGQQHVHHPARHAPGPPRPHHPACPPPRPEDRPLPAMPPPRQPPPQPGQDKPPSSSSRSTRPASLPTVSTGAPLRPHAALPEASAKDHGEGRPGTDTLTVSSRTTPRNRNTGKTSPLTLNDANHPWHTHG
jgi:hypothetical protein